MKEKWKLHSNYVLNFVCVNSNAFNEIKNKENAFTLSQKLQSTKISKLKLHQFGIVRNLESFFLLKFAFDSV